MSYSLNPHLPRLRAKAVDMVNFDGKSIRQTARYFGFAPSTVSRWVKRAPDRGSWKIETLSSRPHSHPKELPAEITGRVVALRRKTGGRCAEVIYEMLVREGIKVSMSSVKRTLDRHGMTKKKSRWKCYRHSGKRPYAEKPGDLVQLDTIHLMTPQYRRIYIYTLLDVYSRWAYARVSDRINTVLSTRFVRLAQKKAPFTFNHLQSDNGPEFSKQFTQRIKINHRHSRVRQPNDNAHLERFNRTIQDELIRRLPIDLRIIKSALPEYLHYYNNARLHLGIGLQTPAERVVKCCEAID